MASQDMPPPGGFGTIPYARTFAKPWMRQGLWLIGTIAATFNGYYVIRRWQEKYRILKIEQVEHYIAASPFLIAEQERKFLRHLRVMREEERELMKDHPGWKLGTLYGEPVFKTLPKEVLPPIQPFEYYQNRTEQEYIDHVALPAGHQ